MFGTALLMLVQSVTPFGVPGAGNPLDARTTVEGAPADPAIARQFDFCFDAALTDPADGIAVANRWVLDGGGYLAQQCLGFAEAERGNWAAAEAAFVKAANSGELAGYPRTANLWAQAGNAALAAGEAARALAHLDAALVQGSLSGLDRGEVHLDRARALVALSQLDAAKQEFVHVHELAADDPLGWLLSATLARRQGDLVTAKNDIAVAARLAGDDPAVALEAANIAAAAGDWSEARANWERTMTLGPQSDAASIAQGRLTQLNADAPPESAP